ncbi:MAG: VOC family protein [Oscillospiraceae bacterium]|nr:VOC family protein [Oscillospiraceae bacterium]
MFTFNHFNFNVKNMEESLKFYDEALGLKPVREKDASDGSYKIIYLGDGVTDFRLELTWLRDHPQAYDLGELEYHLAFLAEDYDAAHAKHAEMGIICYENPKMGIYFITDPDGYWIEVIPPKKRD